MTPRKCDYPTKADPSVTCSRDARYRVWIHGRTYNKHVPHDPEPLTEGTGPWWVNLCGHHVYTCGPAVSTRDI